MKNTHKIWHASFAMTTLIFFSNTMNIRAMETNALQKAESEKTFYQSVCELPETVQTSIALLKIGQFFLKTLGLDKKALDFNLNNYALDNVIINDNAIVTTLKNREIIRTNIDAILANEFTVEREIKVWDIHTHELLSTYNQDSHVPLYVCAIDENKAITVNNDKNSATISNIYTGEILHTFKTSGGSKILKISDGKVITQSESDSVIEIWNIHTGDLLQTLENHIDHGRSIINVWDMHTNKHYSNMPICISSVATSDDKIVIATNDSVIRVWNIKTGKFLHIYGGTPQSRHSVHVDMSGNKVVIGFTGSNDQIVKIWNIDTDAIITLVNSEPIRSIATKSDKIATASQDGTAKIWDINTGQLLYTLQGSDEPISQVEISGNNVLTQSPNGIINIWSFSINLGRPEFNTRGEALTCMKYTLTIPQADLVDRANKSTQAGKIFTIYHQSEDGKVFLTLDKTVRMYLLKHLNIKLEIGTKDTFDSISNCAIQ